MVKINIAHLALGHTTLERQISIDEAELTDTSEFRHEIKAIFEIDKLANELYIRTQLQTKVDLTCDRCLEAFQQQLSELVEIILTMNKSLMDGDVDDMYLIDPTTTEVDVKESVRQAMLTALPVKRLCKEECRGLCPACGINRNNDQCACKIEKIDPRWEALKKLKFDNI